MPASLWTGCLGAALWGAAAAGADVLGPRLGDDSPVDWWFAFKLNAKAFPECSATRKCIFGGEVKDYREGYSLQYLLSSGVDGKTQEMDLHTDCLGSGADPVAKTFAQIYDGNAPNYVIWNDQLYQDPKPDVKPSCSGKSCGSPWGHSKGAMAWDAQGNGFVMQVSSPDWPGNGDKNQPRQTQGNTLGCIDEDNVLVSQHFLALKLGPNDTKAVLEGLRTASVVTDPSNEQLVKLSKGPSELEAIAKSLGHVVDATSPYSASLGVTTSGSKSIRVLAKPSKLQVPPWQLVSAVTGEALRTATWWQSPAIPSTREGTPGCWAEGLGTPKEVQVATSGEWKGTAFSLIGGASSDHNHAKLGHSLKGSLVVTGDMNQQGSYDPSSQGACSSSQNGRGGLFFILDDPTLHAGMEEFMKGETAAYNTPDKPSPSPPPKPSPQPSPAPKPSPSPSPKPKPSPSPSPDPAGDCGGESVRFNTCKTKAAAGCIYVPVVDTSTCDVAKYGCYRAADLPSSCPDAMGKQAVVQHFV